MNLVIGKIYIYLISKQEKDENLKRIWIQEEKWNSSES